MGVIKGAIAVVAAVSDTDNSMLPFDSEERKLDMFPPGQEATNIMPRAIIGVMKGLRINATRKVIAGRATHCSKTPVNTDFGF